MVSEQVQTSLLAWKINIHLYFCYFFKGSKIPKYFTFLNIKNSRMLNIPTCGFILPLSPGAIQERRWEERCELEGKKKS